MKQYILTNIFHIHKCENCHMNISCYRNKPDILHYLALQLDNPFFKINGIKLYLTKLLKLQKLNLQHSISIFEKLKLLFILILPIIRIYRKLCKRKTSMSILDLEIFGLKKVVWGRGRKNTLKMQLELRYITSNNKSYIATFSLVTSFSLSLK